MAIFFQRIWPQETNAHPCCNSEADYPYLISMFWSHAPPAVHRHDSLMQDHTFGMASNTREINMECVQLVILTQPYKATFA